MKKYLKLTSNEAIRHFILRDKTLVPETSAEIGFKLSDLNELESHVSVSIVLPTHRTKPDYDQDPIRLKNLVTQAENQLNETLGKRQAVPFIENIKEAQAMIDHSLNLDSMVLYANEHFASVVKLPIDLPEEVSIGRDFDLRPLYKMRQQNSRYYILAVSKHKIRLIEALNDKVVAEVDNQDFPFINRDYHTADETKLMQDTFEENQYKEYFNDADKMFQTYYNNNPLPVIIAGDVKVVSYYEEQMDRECMVIAKVTGNYDNMPHHEIIKAVQPELEKYRNGKQKEYMDQLDAGESGYIISTDLEEIYQSAVDGNADTLYVGDNFATDNLLKLIRVVRDNGGDTIFVDDNRMEKYNGVALVRRF